MSEISNAPDFVYLCVGDADGDFSTLSEVTWSEHRQGPNDIEYVRVDQPSIINAVDDEDPGFADVHRALIQGESRAPE